MSTTLEKLDVDPFEALLEQCPLAAILKLQACSRTLKMAVEKSVHVVSAKVLDEEVPTRLKWPRNHVYDAERTHAYHEVCRRTKKVPLSLPPVPFVPLPGEFGAFYDGAAQICFGVELPYEELKTLIYLGRRWYKTTYKGNKSYTPPSQYIHEKPFDGYDEYSEFHTEEDLTTYWMSPSDGDSRPPNVKSWKGPWLKYHLPDALADLITRSGLDGLGVSLTFTGFMDCGGDDIVLGVPLGRKLPAAAFDLFNKYGVEFGYDPNLIEGVGQQYVQEMIGLPGAQMAALDQELRRRVMKIVNGLNEAGLGAEEADLCYYVAFHGDC